MKRTVFHPPIIVSPNSAPGPRARRLACTAGSACAGLGALVAIALSASNASAAFTYSTCSGSANDPTILPVDIGTSQYERYAFNPSNYNNNEYRYWNVYFNPNVAIIEPSLNNVNTESGFDYLQIISAQNNFRYSGNYSNGFQNPMFLGGPNPPNSVAPNSVTMLWFSDYSVNEASVPRFDQMALACTTGSAPVSWPIPSNTQVEGVLLGSGDVHYFSVHHSAGERMAISVEVLASPSNSVDLDLYVSKSNQFPDDSSYDYRDFRSNFTGTLDRAGSFITIPSSGSGTYYIGVHSYSGAAHYVLHASGYSTTNKSPYTVCMEGSPLDPNAAYWPNYVMTLSTISARVAQYTGGGVMPLSWVHKVVPTGTCGNDEYCNSVPGCDFVALGCGFQSSGSRTHISDPSNSRCTNYSNPIGYSFTLAHEFGHSQFGFGDEYQKNNPAGQGPFCGHTIMNFPDQSHTLCTAQNHCKDPAQISGGGSFSGTSAQCASGTDGWSQLRASGKVTYVPAFSPNTEIPDQWDSLRNNSYFLDAVSVTP